MVELKGCHLTVRKDHRAILRDVSATLGSGELAVLIGPNGAGKTTLMKTLAGLTSPEAGTVTLDARPLADLPVTERARTLAYLPQKRPLAWPVRVRDIVALGRFAYGSSPSHLRGDDRIAVDQALRSCQLEALANRSVETLSGGEEARMHCARLFAAGAPLVLADEPADALDPFHQHEILQLFRDFADRGGGALIVLHDLSLALQYADRVLIMREGELSHDGAVDETLTDDILTATYGIDIKVKDGAVVALKP